MGAGLLIQPPTVLQVLAHNLRWQALVALSRGDCRVQELVELLDEPKGLVSYHLKRLREAGVVHERRSLADRRDVYYSADLGRLRELYFAAGEALHPALSANGAEEKNGTAAEVEIEDREQAWPPAKVLFLCTHNRARSQMAEALMRHMGGELVEVYSAGTKPGEIHPLALKVLRSLNVDASGQRSTHLDEYCDQSFDYIVTLCDRARETCPVMPGEPEQLHWGFADPAAVEGPEEERYAAFLRTAHELSTRIRFLLLIIEKERRERQGEGKRERP